MRTIPLLSLALALGVGLAGCTTTKQARIRTALLEAGMPRPMADCMAEPLGRDLDVGQLKSLQRAARLVDTAPADMTGQQVLDLLRRNLDPETVGVVARAGLGCFLRG